MRGTTVASGSRHERATQLIVCLGPAQLSWFSAPASVCDPHYPWMEAPDATFQPSYQMGDSTLAVGRGGGPQRLTPGLMLVDDLSGRSMFGSGDSWTRASHSFGPISLDARTPEGSGRSSSSFGVGGVGADWGVRLGYSALRDDTTALRGPMQSGFGEENEKRMTTMGLEARKGFGSWMFSGAAEVAEALLEGLTVSGLWTSSRTLSAQHPVAGGALRFSAAQPRRAEGGALIFDAPIELTPSGRIVYESRIAGLPPSVERSTSKLRGLRRSGISRPWKRRSPWRLSQTT